MKFNDYMNASEAAEFLGVTKMTLYRWEKIKRVKVYRNPINNYRMYKKEDLEEILKEIKQNEMD